MSGAAPFKPSSEVLGDDDTLADEIEADGRRLIESSTYVDLNRYLSAVEGLEQRLVPLDAAIDIALRSRARASGRLKPAAPDAEALINRHPTLRNAINDALAIGSNLVSTGRMRGLSAPAPIADLPCDFGPRAPDGRARYTLTCLLGTGSTGVVYSATDRVLSEPDRPAEVAIKLLSSDRADQRLASRLTEEATKARRVNHPNVVRVLDRGQSDGQPYIVYELLKAGDLQGLLDRRAGRLSAREAVALCVQIARGVEAAHAAGLVHSDIKPANVLLDEQQRVKIADFGIAARLSRALSDSPVRGTGTGPVGNMAFIAPEQFRCEPGCFSGPADIYAIGGVLFFMLTGQHANGDTPEAVANRLAVAQPRGTPGPSIRVAGSAGDESLDRVCARALSPHPADRHASAAALADDLEAWLEHRPISWQRPSVLRVGRLWCRRRPLVAALSVMTGLVFVTGVVSVLLYAERVSRQNAMLLDQNSRFREMLNVLEDVEEMLDPSRPENDDPRAVPLFDKVREIRPISKGGIKPVNGSQTTVPGPLAEPASASPGPTRP